MITPDYLHMMSRYNRWQNEQIIAQVTDMPDADLRLDRGAFFSSILETLNHLLWGDQIWLHRFDHSLPAPAVSAAQHREITQDGPAWITARRGTDAAITHWAARVTQEQLASDLIWRSSLYETDMTTPFDQAVVHFFNHQTHHRGQVHAMLTAAGRTAPVTDLTLMPEI